MKQQHRFARALLLTGAMLFTSALAAQGIPPLFGKSRANNPSRSADIPTTVTATAMDIDLGRNLATLIGNVFVDDQDMTIRCNKMLIYFEDGKAEEKEEKKDIKNVAKGENTSAGKEKNSAAKKTNTPSGAASAEKKEPAPDKAGEQNTKKRPVRVECFGDVVITSKPKPGEKEKKEQKATAGKAVYDLVKDEIDLTEKPVIYDGPDKVQGAKIKIIVNEERMLVLGEASATSAGGLPGKRK